MSARSTELLSQANLQISDAAVWEHIERLEAEGKGRQAAALTATLLERHHKQLSSDAVFAEEGTGAAPAYVFEDVALTPRGNATVGCCPGMSPSPARAKVQATPKPEPRPPLQRQASLDQRLQAAAARHASTLPLPLQTDGSTGGAAVMGSSRRTDGSDDSSITTTAPPSQRREAAAALLLASSDSIDAVSFSAASGVSVAAARDALATAKQQKHEQKKILRRQNRGGGALWRLLRASARRGQSGSSRGPQEFSPQEVRV
jgi:hypothetical protein